MTLAAGSVTVNQSDETRTGSGLALSLYDANVATLVLPVLPTLGDTTTPFHPQRACKQSDVDVTQKARIALLNETARVANANASGFVSYFTANAVSRIVVSAGGLQNTPNPNNPGVATAAPGSPVTLNGTVL